MANLENALREERKQAKYQVEKLDSAISVLEDLVGRNGSLTRTAAGGSRVVTATARKADISSREFSIRIRLPRARSSPTQIGCCT